MTLSFGRTRARDRSRGAGGALAPIIWSADLTNQSVGVASLPSGFTLVRASAAEAYDRSAITSAQVTSNQGRIVKTSAGRLGLLIEESRTNKSQQSQVLGSWSQFADSATITLTANATNAPDGTATADRLAITGNAAHDAFVYFNITGFTANASVAYSSYVRHQAQGGDPIKIGSGSTSVDVATSSSASTSWQWLNGATPATAGGGGTQWFHNATKNPDVYVWGMQAEEALWASSYIPTSGANATRAADALDLLLTRVLRQGRISISLTFEAVCSRANLGRTSYLYAIDASNYATISDSTGIITVVCGGVSWTTTTALTWGAGDLVTVTVEAGGNIYNSSVSSQVNGAAVSQLGSSSSPQPYIAPASGTTTVRLLGDTSAANVLSCVLRSVASYRVGGGPGITASPSAVVDTSSLIASDLTEPLWQLSSAVPPSVEQQCNASGVPQDSYLLNRAGNASTGGMLYFFGAPTGCTSATFSVTAQLPSGVGSGTIVIELQSSTGTVITSTSCVLSGSPQTFTAAGSVTAGTEYRVAIYVHNVAKGTSSQCKALVSGVKVSPTGATGVFASAFKRVALPPWIWSGNRNLRTATEVAIPSGNAFADVMTDASSAVVEYFVPSTVGTGIGASMLVESDGTQTVLTPSVNDAPVFASVSLSTPTSARRVRITTGEPGVNGSIVAPVPRAVYVASTASAYSSPSVRPDVLFVGDSLTAGGGSDTSYSPPRDCWIALLRASSGRFLATDSYGGRTLNASGTGAAIGEQWLSFNANKLWINLDTNDWATAAMTIAAWSTKMQAALDRFHEVNPDVPVVLQGAFHRNSPLDTSTNANSETLTQFNTEAQAIATARSSWVTYRDGYALLSAANIGADNVHPTKVGQAQIASGIGALI